MNDCLLEAIDIRKTFSSPTGPLEILRGINLKVYPKEIVFIVGRSGAGKSTLLHLLGTLDRTTGGEIFFKRESISKMSEREIDRLRNRKMGFIFQFYYLLPELTLYENVMLPLVIAGRRNGSHVVDDLLSSVGLGERRDSFPSQLSGGEQQRAAIARALVNEPEIVFCDEPTGNLDEATADQVFRLLLDLNAKRGQTFCIVTHDEKLVGNQGNVYVLQEGKLELKGANRREM